MINLPRQGVVKGHNGIKRAYRLPSVDIPSSNKSLFYNLNSKGFRAYLKAGAGA